MNNSAALITTVVLGCTTVGRVFAEAPASEEQGSTTALSQGPGNTPALGETIAPDGTQNCSDPGATQTSQCENSKSGRFELGVGYQPGEEFIAKASAVQNRLFGTKHSLRMDAVLSGRRQEFRVVYGVPRLFGSDRKLEVEVYTNHLAYKDLVLNRVGGSLYVSRPMGYGFGIYSRYRLEQVSADLTQPQAVTLGATVSDVGGSSESGTVGALRSGVTYNNGLPRNRRIEADVFTELSSSWMGSDYRLVRAGAKASYRQPLIGPFGLHLQGGLEGVMSEHGSPVPRAERLYFEGHSDVRGVELGSAGSEQGSGFKATSRAELEFSIVPTWGLSGTLFYDAGILGTGDSTELAHSVGGSIVVDSLFAPLRIDLALPLDGSASPVLLLQIGGSF